LVAVSSFIRAVTCVDKPFESRTEKRPTRLLEMLPVNKLVRQHGPLDALRRLMGIESGEKLPRMRHVFISYPALVRPCYTCGSADALGERRTNLTSPIDLSYYTRSVAETHRVRSRNSEYRSDLRELAISIANSPI
jgi:hypothetical protein